MKWVRDSQVINSWIHVRKQCLNNNHNPRHQISVQVKSEWSLCYLSLNPRSNPDYPVFESKPKSPTRISHQGWVKSQLICLQFMYWDINLTIPVNWFWLAQMLQLKKYSQWNNSQCTGCLSIRDAKKKKKNTFRVQVQVPLHKKFQLSYEPYEFWTWVQDSRTPSMG